MKAITQTLLSILIAILSFSFTLEEDITGKWLMDTAYGPLAIHFMEDGTYNVDLGNDGEIDVFGNYTLSNGEVTFKDNGGKMACPPELEGIYSYTLTGDEMIFHLVSDDCEDRAGDVWELTRVE